MKFSEAVKPISYFKSHTSEVIRDVIENQKLVVITQNGKAKVVVQGINEFEKTQESLALLKILAQSTKNLNKGKTKSAKRAFQDLENRIKEFRSR